MFTRGYSNSLWGSQLRPAQEVLRLEEPKMKAREQLQEVPFFAISVGPQQETPQRNRLPASNWRNHLPHVVWFGEFTLHQNLKISKCVNLPDGYGPLPINTICSGMNIHLPAILMWTTGVLLVLTHCQIKPQTCVKGLPWYIDNAWYWPQFSPKVWRVDLRRFRLEMSMEQPILVGFGKRLHSQLENHHAINMGKSNYFDWAMASIAIG